MTRGYPYRRIEDAHYARNAEIKESVQDCALAAIVCQTPDELIAKSTGYEMLAAVRPGLYVSEGVSSVEGGLLLPTPAGQATPHRRK